MDVVGSFMMFRLHGATVFGMACVRFEANQWNAKRIIQYRKFEKTINRSTVQRPPPGPFIKRLFECLTAIQLEWTALGRWGPLRLAISSYRLPCWITNHSDCGGLLWPRRIPNGLRISRHVVSVFTKWQMHRHNSVAYLASIDQLQLKPHDLYFSNSVFFVCGVFPSKCVSFNQFANYHICCGGSLGFKPAISQ